MNELLIRPDPPSPDTRPWHRLVPPARRKPRAPSPARLIIRIRPQSQVVITGRIRSPRTVTVGSGPAYHFTLVDGSGELDVLFLGRPTVRGLLPGTRITVEGRAGTYDGKPALWNPRYQIHPAG